MPVWGHVSKCKCLGPNYTHLMMKEGVVTRRASCFLLIVFCHMICRMVAEGRTTSGRGCQTLLQKHNDFFISLSFQKGGSKMLVHRHHVSVCVSEQEAGGRQMLCITHQSTASKIVPQMRILMRGSVRGSRNSLIVLSQLHLFSLCMCVCVWQWADEPTFVCLKGSASPHISSFSSLTPCSKSGLNTLAAQYGVVLSHRQNRCQTRVSVHFPLPLSSSQSSHHGVKI